MDGTVGQKPTAGIRLPPLNASNKVEAAPETVVDPPPPEDV